MKMRILVVDDDHHKMWSVLTVLRELGLEDIKCIYPNKLGDGDIFQHYDIVVLDYEMTPSGPQVAKTIREKNSEAVIIGYSSMWTLFSRRNEVLDHLASNITELESIVKKILSNKEA